MSTTLSTAAQVAIYFKADKFTGFRACAATYLARFAREYAIYGDHGRFPVDQISKVCKRWNLGDYYAALCRAYQDDLS